MNNMGSQHYNYLIKFANTLSRFNIVGSKYSDWLPDSKDPAREWRNKAMEHIANTIIRLRHLQSHLSAQALELSRQKSMNQYP
jgi:hypothetical protein